MVLIFMDLGQFLTGLFWPGQMPGSEGAGRDLTRRDQQEFLGVPIIKRAESRAPSLSIRDLHAGGIQPFGDKQEKKFHRRISKARVIFARLA